MITGKTKFDYLFGEKNIFLFDDKPIFFTENGIFIGGVAFARDKIGRFEAWHLTVG